jgi:hypothetical protein
VLSRVAKVVLDAPPDDLGEKRLSTAPVGTQDLACEPECASDRLELDDDLLRGPLLFLRALDELAHLTPQLHLRGGVQGVCFQRGERGPQLL